MSPDELQELRRRAQRAGLPLDVLCEKFSLRPRGVAKALDVPLRTVEDWIASGRLPSCREGRVVMVPVVDLLAFLEARRRCGTAGGSRRARAEALLDA